MVWIENEMYSWDDKISFLYSFWDMYFFVVFIRLYASSCQAVYSSQNRFFFFWDMINRSGNYTRDSKPEGERHFSRKQLNYISKLIKTHLSTFCFFIQEIWCNGLIPLWQLSVMVLRFPTEKWGTSSSGNDKIILHTRDYF